MYPDSLMRHFYAAFYSFLIVLHIISYQAWCWHSANTELKAYVNSASNGRDCGGHRTCKTEIFLFSRGFYCVEERGPYTHTQKHTHHAWWIVHPQSLLTILLLPRTNCITICKLPNLTKAQFSYP